MPCPRHTVRTRAEILHSFEPDPASVPATVDCTGTPEKSTGSSLLVTRLEGCANELAGRQGATSCATGCI